jgi:hypothetical protein
VSPLWRDEIRVRLAPSEVHIRRMRRGARPVCAAEITRFIESAPGEWHPAIAALNACLGDSEWRGAHARVVVSNLWARYAIVPWSDTLTSDAERVAHARICLAETYGNTGQDWRVCLGNTAPGEARVACAIPEGLLADLRETLALHGTRMLAVQPALIAAYNRCRDQLPENAGWFVNIEAGALAAARLVPDGWDRVYSARIGADWAMELMRLKTFARLASRNGGNGRVFVDAPARLRRLAGASDPAIEWLESSEGGAGGGKGPQPLVLHS